MDDNNVEAFLNLHPIEDVDMSSDSSKRNWKMERKPSPIALTDAFFLIIPIYV